MTSQSIVRLNANIASDNVLIDFTNIKRTIRNINLNSHKYCVYHYINAANANKTTGLCNRPYWVPLYCMLVNQIRFIPRWIAYSNLPALSSLRRLKSMFNAEHFVRRLS